MIDARVSGAQEFAALSKRLKAAGEDGKGLRRELYRGIQRSTKPLKAAAKQAALADLPSRGGLAAKVARSGFRTKTIGGGRNVGVRITAKGLPGLAALDRGRLRHPVFGNRNVWVNQQVPPRWFTGPMEAGGPKVRAEIHQSVVDVFRKLEGRP